MTKRVPARTPDTAPRISCERLLSILHKRCAMRVFPAPQSRYRADARRLYVVRFSSGLIKIGLASSIKERFSSLHSEARRRFPGCDFSSDVITPVAVVDGISGRPVEAAILKQLQHECLQGEWFRGPLSDALVAALQAESAVLAEARAAE